MKPVDGSCLSAIAGMLSAIDRNDCPQSIGIAVRNRWNPADREIGAQDAKHSRSSSRFDGAVGCVELSDELLNRWLLDGQILDAMIRSKSADQRVCGGDPRVEGEFDPTVRPAQHPDTLLGDLTNI